MSKHTGCGRESVVEKIKLRCFAIKNRSKLKKKPAYGSPHEMLPEDSKQSHQETKVNVPTCYGAV